MGPGDTFTTPRGIVTVKGMEKRGERGSKQGSPPTLDPPSVSLAYF